MTSVEQIESFNKGEIFPSSYEDTYKATKYIQKYRMNIPDDIIEIIKKELNDKNFFISDYNVVYDIVVGLIKGNIILQGPPGTGKTTLASIISNLFKCSSSIITAVSDWTTYDTIGGYQPEIDNDGNERIVGKNGKVVESVIECCNTVLKKEEYEGDKQSHWLIIDELNRSEIDKVFGDLFTAFGSDDPDKRKIHLWFHDDQHKKELFIPNRFRIIGVMNNIDKNFVFDLSQGLSRRFTFININPPTIENFDTEIEYVKRKVKNGVLDKLEEYGENGIKSEEVDEIFEDDVFAEYEKIVTEFIKRIRYYINNESDKKYLGLPIGTAQIIDLYETIIINCVLNNYKEIGEDKKESMVINLIDSAITSRIVPQMDGFMIERLIEFYEGLESDSDLNILRKALNTINELIL